MTKSTAEYEQIINELTKENETLEAALSARILILSPRVYIVKALDVSPNGGRICLAGQLQSARPDSIEDAAALTSPTQLTSIPTTPPASATPYSDLSHDAENLFWFRGSHTSRTSASCLLEVSTPTATPQPYWVYVWVKQQGVGWLNPVEQSFQFKLGNITFCGDQDE